MKYTVFLSFFLSMIHQGLAMESCNLPTRKSPTPISPRPKLSPKHYAVANLEATVAWDTLILSQDQNQARTALKNSVNLYKKTNPGLQ